MELNRISVKLFARDAAAIDAKAFVPLYHKWIQQQAVDGLLIDVADYRHVPEGPGVMLVGHDVEYGMDYVGGRPGLLTVRKRRAEGTLGERLREVLALTVKAAAAIEADGSTGATFDTGELKITLLDRLVAPNTGGTLNACKDEIQQAVEDLYGGAVTLEHGDTDPRVCFNVTVRAASAPKLAELVKRAESFALATVK